MSKWNCLCFSLNPLLLALSLDATEKSLDPSSSSQQGLGSTDVIYPDLPLLQAKWSQLSQPLLAGASGLSSS